MFKFGGSLSTTTNKADWEILLKTIMVQYKLEATQFSSSFMEVCQDLKRRLHPTISVEEDKLKFF